MKGPVHVNEFGCFDQHPGGFTFISMVLEFIFQAFVSSLFQLSGENMTKYTVTEFSLQVEHCHIQCCLVSAVAVEEDESPNTVFYQATADVLE